MVQVFLGVEIYFDYKCYVVLGLCTRELKNLKYLGIINEKDYKKTHQIQNKESSFFW